MSTYTVVFNLPGCLPEAEPIDVESIADARNVVAEHVQAVIDAGDFTAEQREWEFALTAARAIPAEGGWFTLPDGYVADIILKVEADHAAD